MIIIFISIILLIFLLIGLYFVYKYLKNDKKIFDNLINNDNEDDDTIEFNDIIK